MAIHLSLLVCFAACMCCTCHIKTTHATCVSQTGREGETAQKSVAAAGFTALVIRL